MSHNPPGNNPRNTGSDEHPPKGGSIGNDHRHDQRRNPSRDATNGTRKDIVGIPELCNFIYDIARLDSGQDLFVKVTRGIVEYVLHTYSHAGEFHLGMMSEQGLPDLTALAPPARENPSIAIVEIYKLDLKDYRNKVSWRQENIGKVFPMVLNQCTAAVRNKLEPSAEWSGLNQGNDVIGLLQLIKSSLYKKTTTRQYMHSITDAEEALHWFWQGPKMSCREYQKKLIGLIEVYEHLGGEPRTTCRCVRQHMSKTVGARMDADPEYMPDPADLAAVKATARSSYITTILIIRSDKKRYGRLIANAQNDYMKGVPNTYPTTQHAAYEILLNWQSMDPPTQGHGKDSGDGSSMTFRQEEQDADGLSVRKKCTGQQGGGPKSTSQGSDNNSTKQTHMATCG